MSDAGVEPASAASKVLSATKPVYAKRLGEKHSFSWLDFRPKILRFPIPSCRLLLPSRPWGVRSWGQLTQGDIWGQLTQGTSRGQVTQVVYVFSTSRCNMKSAHPGSSG